MSAASTIHHANFIELLPAKPAGSVDRFILLDAQDWMTDDQLNALWTEITRTAAPGARVIFRTAAEPSLLPGRVSTMRCSTSGTIEEDAIARLLARATARRSMAASTSM